MALPTLALTADLTTRGIDTSDASLVEKALEAASAAIRDAAGHPITAVTSTAKLSGTDDEYLLLPAGPVTEVIAVSMDGNAATDFVQDGDFLWRQLRWRTYLHQPSTVTVTYTHGYATVPEDVVELCCSLAAAVIAAKKAGYPSKAGVQSERIDDYQVTYTTGAEATVTSVELPQRTRDWLAARFGGGVGVIGMRR